MDREPSPSRRSLLRWMAAGAAGSLAACRAGEVARDVAKASALVSAAPKDAETPPPASSPGCRPSSWGTARP